MPRILPHRPLARCAQAATAVVLAYVGVASGWGAAAVGAPWSGPFLVDRSSGVPLYVQACTPEGQCVAFDGAGRMLTYTVQTPTAARVAATTIPLPSSLACPVAGQCTAGTTAGTVVTFDPADPSGASAPAALAGAQGPVLDLTCPSAARCVAIDAGQAISFSPSDPSDATAASVAGAVSPDLTAVACPASDQCTAIGFSAQDGSVALTFDPASPADATQSVISPSDVRGLELACVSTSDCVAAGQAAGDATADVALAFDPLTASFAAPRTISSPVVTSQVLDGLACQVGGDCTLLDQSGSLITFDPASGAARTTTVDRIPRGWTGRYLVDVGLNSLQCTPSSSCLAVDALGRAVGFELAAPSAASPALIDPGAPLGGVSCRSISLCTVVGHHRLGLFGVREPSRVHFHRVLAADPTNAQCPRPRLCVVAAARSAVTFTPGRTLTHAARLRLSAATTHPLELRCPSAGVCVTLYRGGRIVSFDPRSRRVLAHSDDGGSTPQGLACPSASQCTVIDRFGAATTFDPRTDDVIQSGVYVDRPLRASNSDDAQQISDLACLSMTECETVDTLGNAVVFDPRTRRFGRAITIDPTQPLTSVACAAGRCTAGDAAGRVLSGRPGAGGWSLTTLSLAGRITSLSCRARRFCIAADDVGHLYRMTVG